MNMNSRRIYQKYKGFTFPGVLILFSLFLFFMVVIPVIKQTLSIYQEAKTIGEEVEMLKKRVSILQRIDEATIESQLVILNSAIPSDKSLPTIMRTVEGLSGQSNITLTSVIMDQPGMISTGSAKILSDEERRFGMHLLPFSVSLAGTFSQLRDFLLQSTQVRRFIRAKAFTVDFSTLGNPEQITTQVLFDAFYSPFQLTENQNQLTALLSDEEAMIHTLVGFPNVGEIPLSQSSSSLQPQISRSDPFLK
jgi:hypothetical protein